MVSFPQVSRALVSFPLVSFPLVSFPLVSSTLVSFPLVSFPLVSSSQVSSPQVSSSSVASTRCRLVDPRRRHAVVGSGPDASAEVSARAADRLRVVIADNPGERLARRRGRDRFAARDGTSRRTRRRRPVVRTHRVARLERGSFGRRRARFSSAEGRRVGPALSPRVRRAAPRGRTVDEISWFEGRVGA
ncbi:MAG: hypothetical protein RIT81_19080 [Deltaproteobacteria bacterium]